MKFFAVHIEDLESEAFIDSTDEQVATWLHLHGVLARLASGPTLKDADGMGSKFWMRKGIDEAVLKSPCKLWSWEGGNLTITPYDAEGESIFLKKKAGGAEGARIRWSKGKNTSPDGTPNGTPIDSANGTLDASNLILSNPIPSNPIQPEPIQSSTTPKKSTKGYDPSQEGIQFAQWFKSSLPESVKLPTNWQDSFAKTFDDLVRLDSRSPEEIRQVCKWARTDNFWKSNFMSPSKLRQRNADGILYYDVFTAKAKAPQSTPSQTPTIDMGGRIATIEEI